jgi:hypothetical protein
MDSRQSIISFLSDLDDDDEGTFPMWKLDSYIREAGKLGLYWVIPIVDASLNAKDELSTILRDDIQERTWKQILRSGENLPESSLDIIQLVLDRVEDTEKEFPEEAAISQLVLYDYNFEFRRILPQFINRLYKKGAAKEGHLIKLLGVYARVGSWRDYTTACNSIYDVLESQISPDDVKRIAKDAEEVITDIEIDLYSRTDEYQYGGYY